MVEFTVGDYVKAALVSAAIVVVGYAVGYGVGYVIDKVKFNKQLKHIDEETIEEK